MIASSVKYNFWRNAEVDEEIATYKKQMQEDAARVHELSSKIIERTSVGSQVKKALG